jgi:hypothetical protein
MWLRNFRPPGGAWDGMSEPVDSRDRITIHGAYIRDVQLVLRLLSKLSFPTTQKDLKNFQPLGGARHEI